jgi:very-short-patch-repair endonuclease
MTDYFNRSEEKDLRRRLRKDMPPAEVLLWSKLRSKQLLGMKFRRQYSVGPYCVDFFCAEIRLAMELDGDTHFTDEAKCYDRKRQAWVESFGIRFLRFTNTDVYENLEGVLHVIASAIESTPLDPHTATEAPSILPST